MYKKRAVVAAATTAIALLGAGVGAAVADPTPLTTTGTTRIAGANRYETAVKVSQQSFKSPQAVVFVASGENFADALSAGPAAAISEAPILLVPKNSLPSVVVTELQRLKPQAIAVIGGTGAISDANKTAIAKYAPAGQTQRIFGANRYATAEEVAMGFDPGINVAYVASGENFADALGGGAAAAAEQGALLLTAKSTLPVETKRALQYLKPKAVVILGGTGAVAPAVATAIKSATGLTPDRYAGADRYDTAAMVASDLWGTTGRQGGLPGLRHQLPRRAGGHALGLHQRRPGAADQGHLHPAGHAAGRERPRTRPEGLPRWHDRHLRRHQGLLTRLTQPHGIPLN